MDCEVQSRRTLWQITHPEHYNNGVFYKMWDGVTKKQNTQQI